MTRVLERTSGPVVLVGHAYSGAVIAAVRDERVKPLVYVAALVPDEGEPVAKVFYRDEAHPDQPKMVPDSNNLVWMPEDAFGRALAHKASAEQASIAAALQRPIAVQCVQEPASKPLWKSKPTWYLVAEEDRMINPKPQRFMAERMGAKIHSHRVKKGATLVFTAAAAWFQTVWFRILCILTAIMTVWILYRLRVRQVARAMSARFDERLAERTRMARELHDTFLQTIQGSKLVADDAIENVEDPIRTRHALEQLSEWLSRAVREGRAALHSLRIASTETNDLAAAFRRALKDCRRETSMETTFEVTGVAREMHPMVRDELYRVGYEAIRNACAHSAGSCIDVSLSYGIDLTLQIRDKRTPLMI